MLNFRRRRLRLPLESLCHRIVVKAFVFDQEPWTVVLSTTILDPNQIICFLYCRSPTFTRPIPVVFPDDQAWLLSPAQIFQKNQPFLRKYSFVKHSEDCLCNLFPGFVCQWTSSQSNQSIWNFRFWNFWCTRVLINHVLRKIRAIHGWASQYVSNCIVWLQLLCSSYLHSIEFSCSPNGCMIWPNQDNVLPKWWNHENTQLHVLKKRFPWDCVICPCLFPISFVVTVSQDDPWSSTREPPCCVQFGSRENPSSQPLLLVALWLEAALAWTAAVESNSSVCLTNVYCSPVLSLQL